MKIGIIGGTGLESLELLENTKTLSFETPYGLSSNIIEGNIGEISCFLLFRHGKDHSIAPSYINYQANIWALKMAGVSVVIATSASGSLKEKLKPGDIVIIDSIIDRTTQRVQTFYDNKKNHLKGVCHIPSHPLFNKKLRCTLIQSAKNLNLSFHEKGTTVCIEGPRYSTYAESVLYKSWGADLVNMTTCPEAILAKELGIIYATIALVTDYDCWMDNYEIVSVEMVDKIMKQNLKNIKCLLINSIKKIYDDKNEIQIEINEAKKVAKAAVMNNEKICNFDYI